MTEVRCAACGATNRIPDDRLGMPARCGKCRAPLATAARPIAVTDDTFGSVVLRSTSPVVVDCWAEWCGPCHAIAPTIDAVARDYAGRVLVAKLDVDANPATAGRFGIRSIPTLLFFQGGRLVDQIVGAQPRGAIDARLRSLLDVSAAG